MGNLIKYFNKRAKSKQSASSSIHPEVVDIRGYHSIHMNNQVQHPHMLSGLETAKSLVARQKTDAPGPTPCSANAKAATK